jgi:hypothetical protein
MEKTKENTAKTRKPMNLLKTAGFGNFLIRAYKAPQPTIISIGWRGISIPARLKLNRIICPKGKTAKNRKMKMLSEFIFFVIPIVLPTPKMNGKIVTY